ncbi:helix-turn-helix domain-containing protein [Streptomyces scabiei]|nr:helix-turn-helix domain-containing protein [Streptomyces sp. LBUM 1484]MBP5888479.1 helix-turn-helix domain-containing protein [Streptomyces sp. LBUM 1487]MBP5888929.1 helix-turn-helix domain-containing protein [Streptomyces sp. LBUM 1481]MBP5904506.1 helix-turn-helix domain-containing protein [Streptomyces sp. LBUM 1488]MBP5911831.1 helix-turn-helix domain-containing protein [Streptomyces sp. LBUM 1486]MBP5918948.1 helix-turn-helix domain-containing protein [Streptomyces sp. LBUM 1483]QTU
MVSAGNAVVARNVRLLREQRGLSLARLAREAGLAKQTLSNLEQGTGNPTVDTLFSIATALGVPVTRLVAEREQVMTVQRGADVVWKEHEGLETRALDHVYGSGVIENYLVRVGPDRDGTRRPIEPHPVGTLEHLYVISGRVRVGPAESPVELDAGDFVRYPGDRPHVYQSLDGESLVHIVVSVPRVQPGTGGTKTQRTHGGDAP